VVLGQRLLARVAGIAAGAIGRKFEILDAHLHGRGGELELLAGRGSEVRRPMQEAAEERGRRGPTGHAAHAGMQDAVERLV
jgi:hypothetical protein